MSKTYEITTLQDIFDKVPADKIRECCAELGELLAATKATAEMMHAIASDAGVAMPGFGESFPLTYPLKWIDDGKGEVATRFTVDGDEVMRVEVRNRR